MLPLADVVLPNQTECEALTGTKITSESEMLAAMDRLHGLGPRTVVVKSSSLAKPGVIGLYASVIDTETNTKRRYTVQIPQIGGYFSGTLQPNQQARETYFRHCFCSGTTNTLTIFPLFSPKHLVHCNKSYEQPTLLAPLSC